MKRILAMLMLTLFLVAVMALTVSTAFAKPANNGGVQHNGSGVKFHKPHPQANGCNNDQCRGNN